MDGSPTIIRASGLPGYPDCQRRWAAKTISREIEAAGFKLNRTPTSIGASVGTAVHGGAAFTLAEKLKSGELGNQTEAEQRAISELGEAAAGETLMDEVTPNINAAEKQVVQMLRLYRFAIAPSIIPVAVEQRLMANVGDGFVISGQSDVQVMQPDLIRDLKTGRHSRQHYAQVGTYSLLARTARPDIPVKGVCVDYIPRVAASKPTPEPVTSFYDQATAEQAAFNTIRHMKADVTEFRRRVSEGGEPPQHVFLANPSSMLCSPKWCPAFGTNFCKEHKQ